MQRTSLAARLRARLALPRWAIAGLAAIYAASQATILWTLWPIRREVGRLQVAGFRAENYRDTFQRWIDAGLMDAYRAHFAFDDLHGVWYAALGTTLLCRLFETRGVAQRRNWLLLLPLATALLDAVENAIQHRFLAAPDFAAIVDPWPLVSTLASIAKWACAATWVGVAVALSRRSPTDPSTSAPSDARPDRRSSTRT